jgi:drug/metabolite transporter (DMT)-like permease
MTPRARADWTIAILTAFWGMTFVLVKDALAHTDAIAFLALRFGVGAIAATAFAGRAGLSRRALSSGGLLGIFLFTGFVLQTYGLVLTTPSRSAFITSTYVLMVPFVSWRLLGKRPGIGSALGVLFAVAGLYLLTGGFDTGGGSLAGDLMTLGCAAAFAVHIGLTEKLAKDLPARALVPPQLALVAILSTFALPFLPHRVEPSASLAGIVLFCGLFASAFAITVQTWAQARTSATRAAILFSMEPVFASALSVALGREALSGRMVAGGALILGGVVVSEVAPAGRR